MGELVKLKLLKKLWNTFQKFLVVLLLLLSLTISKKLFWEPIHFLKRLEMQKHFVTITLLDSENILRFISTEMVNLWEEESLTTCSKNLVLLLSWKEKEIFIFSTNIVLVHLLMNEEILEFTKLLLLTI